MVPAYICRVPKISRFTRPGKDFSPRSFQRCRVPPEPPPAWALARRREIGLRIRDHRRKHGLSQVQLGERIGRDHKTISRWENAIRAPDLNDLLLLAHALDVPLADLVH